MARFMVVDDEPSLRFLNRLNLEERGHDVDEASSADELLERVACGATWDAIVLDQRMPGTTGMQAAQALRDSGVATPIALFSGYLEPGVEADADRLGIPVVDKTDLDGLMELVDRFATAG